MDLLLWFGPHLRLRNVLQPYMLEMLKLLQDTTTPKSSTMVGNLGEVWHAFLEHYNLLSTVSTFPVGVPSLMSGQAPLQTPFGAAPIFEVSSLLVAFGGWLLFVLCGLAIGSLYYVSIARVIVPALDKSHITVGALLWQTLQVILLVVIFLVFIMIVLFPTILISSVLALLSPFLSWAALLGMTFVALWLLIPLIFSPHGIFAFRQNVFNAMLNSARMVRYFLPGTGMFLLLTVVLYEGMSILWRTPPDNSWMTLVGIVGHAFISTGLLAGSFVYYRSGLDWVQALRRAAAMPGLQSKPDDVSGPAR